MYTVPVKEINKIKIKKYISVWEIVQCYFKYTSEFACLQLPEKQSER